MYIKNRFSDKMYIPSETQSETSHYLRQCTGQKTTYPEGTDHLQETNMGFCSRHSENTAPRCPFQLIFSEFISAYSMVPP